MLRSMRHDQRHGDPSDDAPLPETPSIGNTPAVSPAVSPPGGTLEAWAHGWLGLCDPLQRLAARAPAPGELPLAAELGPGPSPAWPRVPPPRPPHWRSAQRAPRSVGQRPLTKASERLELLHTFLHHELQAAELFAYGFLAFPDAPEELRRGLVGLLGEELVHARRYGALLQSRGASYGDWPVRDWFWQRVVGARDMGSFLAFVGLGLEGANLDHTRRFAGRFEQAGDLEAAQLVRTIGAEEIAHVRFACRWFVRLKGPLDLATWRKHLPPPLSERPFVHHPMDRAARERAGFPGALLDAITPP